jgi:hypothetical protein
VTGWIKLRTRFYRILLVRSDHYHNLFSEIRKGKIIRNVSR